MEARKPTILRVAIEVVSIIVPLLAFSRDRAFLVLLLRIDSDSALEMLFHSLLLRKIGLLRERQLLLETFDGVLLLS
jgi:hypothetical protein